MTAPAGLEPFAPDIAATVRAAPKIAFRAHPALPWLVLPDGLPMQVVIDAVPVRVPNTQPWFLGVVSQRGVLLPVFDLAAWAGLRHDPSERMQIASIGSGNTACRATARRERPARRLPRCRFRQCLRRGARFRRRPLAGHRGTEDRGRRQPRTAGLTLPRDRRLPNPPTPPATYLPFRNLPGESP